MSAHTQGSPWVDGGLTGVEVITGGPLRLIMSGGFVVAFLPCWLDDEANAEEARANSRLIAAAPDMLAALQALSDALPSDEYMRAQGQIPGPGLVAMRAAIAKATGAAS